MAKKNRLTLLKRLYKAERVFLKRWQENEFISSPCRWNVDKDAFDEDEHIRQVWKRSEIKHAIWIGYGNREKALCKHWQRSRRWRSFVEVQLAAGISLNDALKNMLEQARAHWQSSSKDCRQASLCSFISNFDFCSLYPFVVSTPKPLANP